MRGRWTWRKPADRPSGDGAQPIIRTRRLDCAPTLHASPGSIAAVARTVQIRNVDDATYATLRARAVAADLSLTQYLRRELEHLASTPTFGEWLDRADQRRARYGGVSWEAVEAASTADRADRR